MEQDNHKVRIRIRSSQEFPDNDCEDRTARSDEIETVVFGKYYRKNDRHYLFYEEWMEGAERVTSSRVTITPERMELVRKGAVNTVMTFEQGRMVRGNYHTPYGVLAMGVDTQKLLICENEDGLLIQAEYLLEVNGEYASRNRMEFKVDF